MQFEVLNRQWCFRSTTARMQLLLLVIGAFLTVPNALQAQEADPGSTTFTEAVQVRVVNVEVTVTDRSGVPIAGLSADDFELRVDGDPVAITNFYAESGGQAREAVSAVRGEDSTFRTVEEVATEPRGSHVVVLVDNNRLGLANRKRAFSALRAAVDRLPRQDLVAVVGIEESSLVYYSDFLFDRTAVHRILDGLLERVPPNDLMEMERRRIFGELTRGQSGGIQARASLAEEGPIMSRIRAYAAQEYQHSVNSLRQIERVVATMAGVRGRKLLFYLGEGVPTRPGEGLYVEWRNRFGGSEDNGIIGMRRIDFSNDYTRAIGRYDLSQPVQQLAAFTNRAGVTMYAIDAESSHGGEVRSALTEQGATSETISVVDENYREPLESASKATGGKLLRSSGLLQEQLTTLVQEVGIFYSLGFTPPPEWQPGSQHDIKVRVKQRGFQTWHRDSVALPQRDEREASATVAALMYQSVANPLQVSATPGEGTRREDGLLALPINVEIPVAQIGLLPAEDIHASQLTIYVTTKSHDGQARQVQKIPFDLRIPADKVEEAQSQSAHYALPVVLRPGDQQVAIGVADNVRGVFSALRIDVAGLAPPRS